MGKTVQVNLTPEEQITELITKNDVLDTVTKEDNLDMTPQQLRQVWETAWHDFVPEDLVTFVIEHGEAFELREMIKHENPTLIKGAYYVHGAVGGGDSDSSNALSVMVVTSPDDDAVWFRSAETQGIVEFNTT